MSVCLVGVCSPGPAAPNEWPTAPEAAQILREAAAADANWSLVGEVATYGPDTLWKLIDGAAGQILAYRYAWTVAAVMADERAGTKVSVDIYGFETPLDAFGACMLARNARLPGAAIPLRPRRSRWEAYWVRNHLYAWWGPMHIRVSPAGFSPSLREPALEVGRAIVARLPTPPPRPRLLQALPRHGLLVESVRFEGQDILGQTFLKDAALATYGERDREGVVAENLFELALFEGADSADACNTFDRLLEHLKDGGEVQPLAGPGDAAFAAEHPRYRNTQLHLLGRYVAMLWRITDPDAARRALQDLPRRLGPGGGPALSPARGS